MLPFCNVEDEMRRERINASMLLGGRDNPKIVANLLLADKGINSKLPGTETAENWWNT